MKREHVANIITALLIILFVYAGLIKLLDYQIFRNQLSSFPLIKDHAAGMAWRLPVFELILSYFLLWPRSRLLALYTSFLLLLSISVYIVMMLSGDYVIPCACSGVITFMSWTWHLGLNIIFMLLTITGIWAYKKAPPVMVIA
jgi:hypothetical protein